MTRIVAAGELDLRGFIRSGDGIMWGQACGEPVTLTKALVAQRADLGGVSAFVGSAFSDTLQPEHADHIAFSSMGAIGTLSRLAAAGVLGIVPTHVGQIGALIAGGQIRCDVALVQVNPAGPDGLHSFGLIADYVQAMVKRARVVIAEVNDQVPFTSGGPGLEPERIDVLVETSRPLIQVPAAAPTEGDRAIARAVSEYIEDGSVIQMGIGSVPEAVTQLIADRRHLGVHSGMIGDGIAALIESGAVDNSRKRERRGITVTGALIGTRRLYDLANLNPAIELHDSSVTHGDGVLSAIERLVTINSAVEVDLSGQVNAEQTGSRYVGGTGGQVDYVRGGARSSGGRSIIALPATAKGGTISRIVGALAGPVTTARSEVDVIVTEYGAAELKGQPIAERARRMIAIAHPEHREGLEREAHAVLRRGF
jgi:acyl-CoA hydrolase